MRVKQHTWGSVPALGAVAATIALIPGMNAS